MPLGDGTVSLLADSLKASNICLTESKQTPSLRHRLHGPYTTNLCPVGRWVIRLGSVPLANHQ